MPADMNKLQQCLTDMKRTYLTDPTAAVIHLPAPQILC